LASAFGVALLLAVPAVALMGLGLGTTQAAQTPVSETALLPFNAPTSTLARLQNNEAADPLAKQELVQTLLGFEHTADDNNGTQTFPPAKEAAGPNEVAKGISILITLGFVGVINPATDDIFDDVQPGGENVGANGRVIDPTKRVVQTIRRLFRNRFTKVLSGDITFVLTLPPGIGTFVPPVTFASLNF